MIIEFHDFVGFSGAIIIIIAYFLLQAEKMTAEGIPYSVINLLGALLILYSLYFSWNSSAVFIEIAWIGISTYGIFRRYRRKYSIQNNLLD